MIKHIVMWKLKDSALGFGKMENAEKIKVKLESLKGEIDGILEIEVGINECDSDQAFDVVLYSVFKDMKSLEAYHVHPKHVEVGKFVGEVREDRVVVDYRI